MESDNKLRDKSSNVEKPQTKKRNKRWKKKSRDQNEIVLKKCPLLCFDSETTNHGELLELSVFDGEGQEAYHSYFRPHAKKWPSDIHHITPEMVEHAKRFIAHRGEIGRLLRSSKYLLGCALSNDIHNLRRHGVPIDDNHVVIDIQNWYWLLKDHTDRHEKYQTGLAAIGETYGLDFGEEQAHSATADTRLTLSCFRALVDDFNRQFPESETEEVNLNDENYLNRLIARYNVEYKRALHVYKMRNAGGFVSVVRREQGFSLKFHRNLPDDCSRFVMSIEVGDRAMAEQELRIFLKPRELRGLTGIYDLRESEFEYLRNYTNELDEDSYLEKKGYKKISPESKTRIRSVRKALSARTASPRKLSEKTRRTKKSRNDNSHLKSI